jgi:hypothetical protein
MDAETRRILREEFRTLLEKTLAETARSRESMQRLQVYVRPATGRFETIFDAHSRREFMPARVEFFKSKVKNAMTQIDEFERMFGDDDNLPLGYVDAVKGDALKTAGGDKNAVEVAAAACEIIGDLEYTLERLDDAIHTLGGGEYSDLSDRAKGTIVAPEVGQARPASGNVAMYKTVLDDIQVLHDRFQALSDKAEEMAEAYEGEPGELFTVADDDDAEEVDYVKTMYGRCSEKLGMLTETRRGLEIIMMNLSGHFEPARSPEPESDPEPE